MLFLYAQFYTSAWWQRSNDHIPCGGLLLSLPSGMFNTYQVTSVTGETERPDTQRIVNDLFSSLLDFVYDVHCSFTRRSPILKLTLDKVYKHIHNKSILRVASKSPSRTIELATT